MDTFFEMIMRWWRVDERPGENIDAVVAISYGATKHALTTGGFESLKRAAEIFRKNGGVNAAFVFGVFTPTADPEKEFRDRALRELGIPEQAEIYIAHVASTIEEALRIKEMLAGRSCKAIVVIAGAGHSRRARLVWKREFPKSDIRVLSFPWQKEIQKDHPMVALRNRWSWLFVNMILHLIFLTPFGYAYFRKNCKTMRQVTVT